ncbi:unnamed protein product [Musa textilis]
MGDEGHAKAPAEEPPATKKRARDGGDLKRVAEIVMVLSAMGQMRGGRQPTAAEKALVAEARERLVAMCEGVKPKELFSGEAVRVVVEDLGLNRSKDPVMGFRPPKMSIADRLLLTKKKVSYLMVNKTWSIVAILLLLRDFAFRGSNCFRYVIHTWYLRELIYVWAASHSAKKKCLILISSFLLDSSTQSIANCGIKDRYFQCFWCLVWLHTYKALVINNISDELFFWPKLQIEESKAHMQSSVCSPQHLPVSFGAKSDIHGTLAYDASRFMHDRTENVSQKIPTISSVQSTSAAVVKFGQANKLPDHISVKSEGALGVNAVKTSHQTMINHETKPSMMQAGQGTLHIVHQPSQGLTVVQTPALFTNHNDIAKSIQRILQANISDHPIWTPPSTEYMNSTLNCQVCKNAITDIESLLVCDACEKGNHLKCLQSYGNKGIPKAEWHCPRCLASSNGKPLPPKYGRVTRAPIGAPKATSNASIHASTKKTENLDKVNQQKAIPSGISGVSQHAYSLNEEGKHHDPVPDSRTTSPEVQVTLTTVGDKRANETCNLIGCNNLKEVSGPVCTPPGTHCEDTNNIENNRLSLAGTKPTAESVLQPSTASENSCEHSHDMDVENNHLSKVPFSHNFDEMKLPSDGKSPANELDKDAKLAMTKPEEALGEKNLPENIDGCNARLTNEGSTQSTADRDGYTMNQKANLG